MCEPYTKKNNLDIVLFCGSPGAGKSTFYWKQVEPLGYVRVNQDILKTVCANVQNWRANLIFAARKMYQGCRRAFRQRQVSCHRYVILQDRKTPYGTCSDDPRVLDNTNADSEVRSKWVELAATHSVPIRCVLFTASSELCEHNDVVRALNNVVCAPFPTNIPIHPNGCCCTHQQNVS